MEIVSFVFIGILSIILFYILTGSRKVSLNKYIEVQQELNTYKFKASMLQNENNKYIREHNKLVRLINEKGGQYFLDNAVVGGKKQFTDQELRSLLQLVHPDKHGGKESARVMTQKINQLRSR